MINDFEKLSELSHFLSKDYAGRILALLTSYRDISASEAASRLGIHVRTAQEFLEGLTLGEILEKREVFEKKRPYFRYSLAVRTIEISVDLDMAFASEETERGEARYRERKDSRARFATARGGDAISNVTIWTGEGREREEKKINLTGPQGVFLYHLPFPGGEPMSVDAIMEKAGLPADVRPEIIDIVGVLEDSDIIEAVR